MHARRFVKYLQSSLEKMSPNYIYNVDISGMPLCKNPPIIELTINHEDPALYSVSSEKYWILIREFEFHCGVLLG